MLFLQIINAILGSGVLGIPYVLVRLGIVGGLAMLTGVCLIMTLSGLLLIRSLPATPTADRTSLRHHIEAGRRSPWGKTVCVILIVLGLVIQEMGAMISYIFLIISSVETLPPAVTSVFLVIFLIWLSVQNLSGISGFSILVMVLFLVYKFSFVAMPTKLHCIVNNQTNETLGMITAEAIWTSMATCTFATVCHTTLASLACLHGAKRTRHHFMAGMAVTYVLYCVVAVGDFFTFPIIGDNILDVFVNCIPWAVPIVALYRLSILTTIPVLFVSICGELSHINPMLVKTVFLIMATLLANVAHSLGMILSVSGLIAGLLNVIVAPLAVTWATL